MEEARQRTGAPVHVSYAPVQLLRWLVLGGDGGDVAIDEGIGGGVNMKVKVWQSLPSLIAARWCCLQSAPISYSEASWTGLLDFRKLEVRREASQLIVLEGCVYLLNDKEHLATNDSTVGLASVYHAILE